MPTLSGTITEQEYLQYGGVEISLLNDTNGNTTSGGHLEGEGTYNWSITWDDDGFTGVNWEAFSGTDLLERLGSVEEIISRIENDPVTYAISVATTNWLAHEAGCAVAERTS